MKWFLSLFLTLTVMCLTLTALSAAYAEPLDGKRVAADANWLIHVDLDAMKAGTVPRTIAKLWIQLPSAPQGLKALSRTIGMDPTEDLHSITIYGKRYSQPTGVVILRADVDRRRLDAFLKRKPDYRVESYGNHELIIWTENKGKKDEHTVTGCFHEPTVIVFGREAAEVKTALDVLNEPSRGLAEGSLLFVRDVPGNTMIQARAAGLADLRLFKSPLVQQSRFLVVAVGERDGEAFVSARLLTESEEIAGRVRAVVEGFRAMAEFHFESDPEVVKILEDVKVSTAEKTVNVECRGPAADVARLIEKAWAKQLTSKQAD